MIDYRLVDVETRARQRHIWATFHLEGPDGLELVDVRLDRDQAAELGAALADADTPVTLRVGDREVVVG